MRTFALSLALVGPVAVLAASGTGETTRYWDCCKPSCAWDGKADVSAPVLTCDANDNPISDANAVSGCDGGSSYTCSDNSPWEVNENLAYGFAATNIEGGSESTWCCACYALTFTSGAVEGKTMIVQSTNTGSDLGTNQFDILIPGGGEGIFDGCTSEFNTTLEGAQYGGVSSASQCLTYPTILQDGCEWRFNWFQGTDNPSVTFSQVSCPTEITDKSGCVRDDDGDYPTFTATGTASGSTATSKAAAASTQAASSKTSAVSSSSVAAATSSAQQAEAIIATSIQAAAPTETQAAETAEAVTSEAAEVSSQTVETTSKAGGCRAKTSTTTLASASAVVDASSASTSTVAIYGQCNGSSEEFPNGALACASGSTCVYSNEWYSQCQPTTD